MYQCNIVYMLLGIPYVLFSRPSYSFHVSLKSYFDFSYRRAFSLTLSFSLTYLFSAPFHPPVTVSCHEVLFCFFFTADWRYLNTKNKEILIQYIIQSNNDNRFHIGCCCVGLNDV